MSFKCRHCGSDNRENVRFCETCGRTVELPEAQAPVKPPEQTLQPGEARESQISSQFPPTHKHVPAQAPASTATTPKPKKKKSRSFKTVVVVVVIVCLLAAGGLSAILLIGRKTKTEVPGMVTVKGKVGIPEGTSIRPQDLTVTYSGGEKSNVSSTGDFQVNLNGSATALLRATDKKGDTVLQAVAPKDKLVPDYKLEVTPESSAVASLFLTPGITNEDPVFSFLTMNALWQQQGAKDLANLIKDKMKTNPTVVSNPDEEMAKAAASAIDSFMNEVGRNAPPGTPTSLRSPSCEPGRQAQARLPLGSIISDPFLAQVEKVNLNDCPEGAGKDLELGLTLQKDGDYLKLSWDNPICRWVVLYNDAESTNGGPDTSSWPLTAALPRRWEIPGLWGFLILCMKADPTVLYWHLVKGDIQQYIDQLKKDWQDYYKDHWGHVAGERKFTYDGSRPYLQLYTMGGMGGYESPNRSGVARYTLVSFLTCWSLYVNPLVGLIWDTRIDENGWRSYEVLKKLQEFAPKFEDKLSKVWDAMSRGDGADSLKQAYGLLNDLANYTDLMRLATQLREDFKDLSEQAQEKLASVLSTELLKVATKSNVISLIIDLVPVQLTLWSHQIAQAVMCFTENNYDCYRIKAPDLETKKQPGVPGSDTAFVLDVSGSMEGQKIEDAKNAAVELVNMIQNEANTQNVDHQIGLVTFTTNSSINMDMSNQMDAVLAAIQGLKSQESTNMEAGIRDGTQILEGCPPNRKRIILLLSDGQPNVGASDEKSLLGGVVADAQTAGITINTIGFGSEGDLNVDLLKAIANATGGTYSYAKGYFGLASAYVAIRHEATGKVILKKVEAVPTGSQVRKGSFEVLPGQGELNGTLNWSGGQSLELVLKDPSGTVVDSDYVGAQMVYEQQRFVQYIIKNPKPGIWRIEVGPKGAAKGANGRGGGKPYALATGSDFVFQTAQITQDDNKDKEQGDEYQVVFSTKGRKTPIKDYTQLLLIVTAISAVLAILAFIFFSRRVIPRDYMKI